MHFYWHCPHFMFLASYFTSFCFMHPFSLVARLCLTLCNPMDCSMPDFPVHHQLQELAQTHVHQVSDAIHSSHPLSFPSPPAFSVPASGFFPMSQFFASGGQSIGATALTSVLPIEYSGLISFRMDWLDFLAVQGTLKSLLQHHSPKASIFWCLAFFIVQLTHPYMTTGKTIALIRQTFVGIYVSLPYFYVCIP